MKYPYYIVPEVEEYRKLEPGSEEAGKLARLLAANIGDYASLRLILGIDPPEFARFYPDLETTTPSTMDTIDSFLDKFGGDFTDNTTLATGFSGYVLEEDDETPVNPNAENNSEESQMEEKVEWVENINENNHIEEKCDEKESETEKENTKDLFSMLIKEKRYQEAIQFIEEENLNNREKSIYFAHQIRFIKKLIAIEKYRKLTQG